MTFRQFLDLVELRTKAVSASTLAVSGLYLAWRSGLAGLEVRWPAFGLACAAAFLVDMGTTAFNSFYDAWRGLDRKATNREADKVIVHEGVPALAALLAALALFACAALLGLVVALLSGPWVLAVGALSMLAGFAYSGGPLPVSRTPFGEVVAGGFLGSVLFLVAFRVGSGFWDGAAALASLPLAALIAAILAVNNACDLAEDREGGRKTLAVLVGPRRAPAVVAGWLGLGLLMALALVAGGLLPWPAGLALGAACLPMAREIAVMFRRGFSHLTKGPNMGAILRTLLWWSLGMAVGLAAASMSGIRP